MTVVRALPALLILACTPALSIAQPSATGALLAQLSHTKHIGDVALSPDGKRVAMVLAGDLVVAPVADRDAGHPVRLCADKPDSKGEVSSLSWSPDAAQLAVLADCGSGPDVLLTTGEPGAKPRMLASLHGFAKALEYTPDGRSLGLLYVEGATRPSGALAAEKPPSGEIGVEGLEVQRVAMIDAQSGQLTQATPPGLHVFEFSFSPDSKQIAFVAAAPPGENNWWIAKLYTKPVGAGGEPKVILDPDTVEGSLHGLQIAVPRWSPDGKQIAFIGGLMSDQGATGGDIYLVPGTGGTPQKLTKDVDRYSAAWLRWNSGDSLIVSAFIEGHGSVLEVTIHADPNSTAGHVSEFSVRQFFSTSTFGDGRLELSLSLSADNQHVAFAQSSYNQAPEVWAGCLSLGPCSDPIHPITHLNADLKPSWGRNESITWTSDNYNVQGWLLYPPNYDPARKYGLIVMVHGGPSSAVIPRWPHAGFGPAPLAASGYFVLEANPRGSYGEGEAFTQANRKDFGYGDLRDILAGVDAVEKQIPAIDDHRLGLTGWSYGGFMTMFGVTQTHRFKAAVAGAGISDWLSYYGENAIDQWMTPFFGAAVYKDPAVYAKSSAINYIGQVTTPTLIVVGDRDGECPAPQSFEFWHALKAFDVRTTLVVYPDEGHGFVNPEHQRDVIERSIRWFNQYLQ